MNATWLPERRAEVRTIVGISMPLAAAYLAEMAMVITDMIIVGRLGSNQLAAVGLGGDWFWVLLLIGMGVVSIVGVLAAHALGVGDNRAIAAISEQGMIAAAIASIPVMACVWYLGPVLSFAGQDPEIVGYIADYCRIITFAVPPALFFVALRNYVTALAHSVAVGWITLVALVFNVALNYTFVYGKFGLPALGVAGAALGTTIVNWGMFAALAWHVKHSRRFAAHRPVVVPRRVDRALLGEMFRLGIPISATQFLNGAMFTVAAVAVGMIGATTLAAQQIVYSVIYVSLAGAAALGEAVRVRVAFGIGRRSVPAARQSARISFVATGVASLAGSLWLWLFPEVLAEVFLDTSEAGSAEVRDIAVDLSVYAGMFLLLDGVLIVAANAIRGLRDTRSPLMISLAGYWAVGLGLGIVFCFALDKGAAGLWWGLVAGVLTSNVLMFRKWNERIDQAHTLLPST